MTPAVIAIDPGKETGWATLNQGSFQSGQQPLQYVLHFIYESMKTGAKMEVVCEDFIITFETLRKSRQVHATEGIGALRFLTTEFDMPFFLQSPSAAKRFSSNDKLKKIGWHTPGQDHANDAARHLLLHAVENGMIDVRQFM